MARDVRLVVHGDTVGAETLRRSLTAVQHDVRRAAKALVAAVPLSRAGRFPDLEAESDPRPK